VAEPGLQRKISFAGAPLDSSAIRDPFPLPLIPPLFVTGLAMAAATRKGGREGAL